MGDIYVEQLIKTKMAGQPVYIRIGAVALTVVCIFLGLTMIPLLLTVGIGLAVVDILLFKDSTMEYEYIYMNGDIDVDRIIAKQRRKRMMSFQLEDMVVIAKANSGEVKPYQKIKVYDFSSGTDNQNVYKMIVSKSGTMEAVLFEPNEKIIQDMKRRAPRKVFTA